MSEESKDSMLIGHFRGLKGAQDLRAQGPIEPWKPTVEVEPKKSLADQVFGFLLLGLAVVAFGWANAEGRVHDLEREVAYQRDLLAIQPSKTPETDPVLKDLVR